jgi:hypothetical protein
MKIYPGKRKTIIFRRAQVKTPLGYSPGKQEFRNGSILNILK